MWKDRGRGKELERERRDGNLGESRKEKEECGSVSPTLSISLSLSLSPPLSLTTIPAHRCDEGRVREQRERRQNARDQIEGRGPTGHGRSKRNFSTSHVCVCVFLLTLPYFVRH